MAYLELAALIYDQTGHYIMNPRKIHAQTLLDVDEDWVQDLNRYLKAKRFYRDYDKRPAQMR